MKSILNWVLISAASVFLTGCLPPLDPVVPLHKYYCGQAFLMHPSHLDTVGSKKQMLENNMIYRSNNCPEDKK